MDIDQFHHPREHQSASEKANNKIPKEERTFFTFGAEEWTAIFTGVLAVFTIGLAVFTYRLFRVTQDGIAEQGVLTRKALRHSKRSAVAAITQVENLTNIERPLLSLKEIAVKPFTILADNKLSENHTLYLFLQNYGRSPAELASYFITVTTVPPKGPGATYAGEYFYPPGAYRNPGETECFPFIFNIRQRDIERIEEGEINLWVYGFSKYESLLGGKHECRFCRMALYRGDRAGNWFDWVGTDKIPPEYLKRT